MSKLLVLFSSDLMSGMSLFCMHFNNMSRSVVLLYCYYRLSMVIMFMNVIQTVPLELPCGYTTGQRSGSSVLHNSVGGGTLQSARGHLIKFLLLQLHSHVHTVMFTQEA